jgi:hypothetical protein
MLLFRLCPLDQYHSHSTRSVSHSQQSLMPSPPLSTVTPALLSRQSLTPSPSQSTVTPSSFQSTVTLSTPSQSTVTPSTPSQSAVTPSSFKSTVTPSTPSQSTVAPLNQFLTVDSYTTQSVSYSGQSHHSVNF